MTEMSATELLNKGLAQPAQQKQLELAGTQLNILQWGDPGRPGLLFLHGGAAHAGWWRFIAPFFLPDYHCVAVDISGHGDSARRTEYTAVQWCEEVLAVIRDQSLFTHTPAIICHSMGGLIGIRAAVVLAKKLPGLVIIDTSVRRHQPNHPAEGNNNDGKQKKENTKKRNKIGRAHV